MIALIIYTLTAYSISNIIVHGSIFEWWRSFCDKWSPKILGKLFRCMMCLPAWIGFILAHVIIEVPQLSEAMGMGDLTQINGLMVYITIFMTGMYTSGSTWLIHTVQEYFERK